MSAYQRFLYTAFIVVPSAVVLFFAALVVTGEMPVAFMILPLVLFGGLAGFMGWMLARGLKRFDAWWNSLPAEKRTDIEQDFRQGEAVSRFLIAGPRYAFLRNTGRVVPCERISGAECVRGRNGRCYVHIEVADEKKVFCDLPDEYEAETVCEALYSCCYPENGETAEAD